MPSLTVKHGETSQVYAHQTRQPADFSYGSSYHLVTVPCSATRVPSPSREDAVGNKAVRGDRQALGQAGPAWVAKEPTV